MLFILQLVILTRGPGGYRDSGGPLPRALRRTIAPVVPRPMDPLEGENI